MIYRFGEHQIDTDLFEVKRGSDVVKALALGARGVFVGRPAVWGLAADGEAGAARSLDLIGTEFERTLTLMGAASPRELGLANLSLPWAPPPWQAGA